MSSLSLPEQKVSPSITAALLLTAVARLRDLGLAHPTAKDVLAATGTGHSQAYDQKARLETTLEQLSRPVGRPAQSNAGAPMTTPTDIARHLLEYVSRHPGCVVTGEQRRRYSVGFRLCALELYRRYQDITVDDFAQASTIPLGTLKDWLRGGSRDIEAAQQTKPVIEPACSEPQLETILDEWRLWNGSFSAFCDHIQKHCHIPFGRTFISSLLEASGARFRKRRTGRSPDEVGLRGRFETFFANAQWVGDGSLISVGVDDEVFTFNVEMDVDAYSAAFIGTDVSDAEDSTSVIATQRDAAAETGTLPLALLLDNKPCNHTDAVKAELGDTLLIRATTFRPENKAHMEGGFGLLKSNIDDIHIDASSHRELARSVLRAVVTTFGRTINHRPRKDRGGRSRADLLNDKPTPEQAEQARRALQQRLREQEKKRETEAARQNPIVRQTIADAHERLHLDDPHGHELTATARYPLDAVVDGIAIFEGRRRANTLPDEKSTAAYLRGIVENIAEENEGWQIALALWDARVAAGERINKRLQHQRDAIAAASANSSQLIKAYVDHALDTTTSRLDMFFWLTAAADIIRDEHDVNLAFRLAARRIASTHSVKHRQRLAAIRFLATKLFPLR